MCARYYFINVLYHAIDRVDATGNTPVFQRTRSQGYSTGYDPPGTHHDYPTLTPAQHRLRSTRHTPPGTLGGTQHRHHPTTHHVHDRFYSRGRISCSIRIVVLNNILLKCTSWKSITEYVRTFKQRQTTDVFCTTLVVTLVRRVLCVRPVAFVLPFLPVVTRHSLVRYTTRTIHIGRTENNWNAKEGRKTEKKTNIIMI